MNPRASRFFILTLVILLSVCYPFAMATTGKDSDNPDISEGNTRFALDLYAQLKAEKGNLFFSPYSISTALAMTHTGARGNTAEQMAEVLHLPSDQQQVNAALAKLQEQLNTLQAKGDIKLNIANGLWVQQDYPLLATFLDLVEQHYRAKLQQADFKTAFETVRREINAWVEKQTNDKIKDLLKPGMLNAMTRLVLVNAIYFKGNWANQFEQSATQNAEFFVDSGTTVEVPMMTQKRKFRYMENDSLQALELPYAGDDLSMVILLPKQVDGLAELEKLLTKENLDQWFSVFRKQEVMVFFPRFTMTSEFSLAPTLGKMGMVDAFVRGKADLSGMDGSRELFISNVAHKAFIDVNEQGTEAAAATGITIELTAVAPQPVVFRADHPFLFLIRENRSGSILFLGRLVDPPTSPR